MHSLKYPEALVTLSHSSHDIVERWRKDRLHCIQIPLWVHNYYNRTTDLVLASAPYTGLSLPFSFVDVRRERGISTSVTVPSKGFLGYLLQLGPGNDLERPKEVL